MKVYAGDRTIDGIEVTVDGKPLPERYDIKQFTDLGFEWTYEGASPQQLALAILADHLDDPEESLKSSAAFMKAVISELSNEWQLSSADIDEALKKIRADR